MEKLALYNYKPNNNYASFLAFINRTREHIANSGREFSQL